jgi:hypothetical protein
MERGSGSGGEYKANAKAPARKAAATKAKG